MVTLTAKYKPYPAYKPSGVEWLAEIPAHWEVRRLKYSAPFENGKLDNKPEDAIYVGLENIEPWTGELLLDYQPESVDSTVVTFAPGDVLFGKLRPYLAKVARPDFEGTATSEVLVMRPLEECLQSYLAYCLLNAPYIRWIDTLTYGAKMPRVSPDEVACSFIPLPLLPEQRVIAAFLDRETARIDALVSKKERLIELLQEKRTALITRTATKGLDPNAPVKDSGVEWLGEIPAYWEVKRLKYATALNPKASEVRKLAPDTEVSFVPMEAVGEYGGLDLSQTKELSDVAGGYTYFGNGDVLVAKITPCFENGKGSLASQLVNGVAFGTTELHVLRCGPNLDKRFTFYLTLTDAFRKLGEAEVYGAGGQKRVPESFVANLKHPFPSLPEQRAIAAFLDREMAKLDSLVSKVREAIERLKELRTALISAAVTGRIDVREEAS